MHSWLLAEANRLRRAGVPKDRAVVLLTEAMSRPPSPPNEVEAAVAKAYSTQAATFATRRPGRERFRRPLPITTIEFDPARLRAIAARLPVVNWRHWLSERSPIRPECVSPLRFLSHLFNPGETVLVFDDMQAKRPRWAIEVKGGPQDFRAPAGMLEGGKGQGLWFLSNPVDGRWHATESNGRSMRSKEAVTAFRHVVLESDKAPAADFLGFIAQLPARIVAIYTSGKRSVHVLVRIDAPDKAGWDAVIAPLKRPLALLGVDPAALSAVRLTRLPGCWRPECGGFQKLLYLNPDPSEIPLADLPIRENRADAVARWRHDYPRCASSAITSPDHAA